MSELPAFPQHLTLPALQEYVARIVEVRGFTQDLDRVFILWVEELGELADVLGGAEGLPIDRHALAAELADVTLYIADLATGLGVDLDAALRASPAWNDRPVRQDATLRDWQTAVPAPTDKASTHALLRLLAAAGELARTMRKRWSGQHRPAAGGLMARALTEALTVASVCGIDLTRAIEDKETTNAHRTWTY